MPAVAVTDHGNLYGSLSFYHKMRAEGVKPIIGIEAYIARGSRHDKGSEGLAPGEKATNHIVLLAKNLAGYHNLVKLSYAFIEGFWRKPRIDRNCWPSTARELSGCRPASAAFHLTFCFKISSMMRRGRLWNFRIFWARAITIWRFRSTASTLRSGFASLWSSFQKDRHPDGGDE